MTETNFNREPRKNKGSNRHYFYKLLQIGKSDLCWDDEFYYGIWLPQQGAIKKDNRYSATTMTIGQLSSAIEVMKRLGFVIKPKKAKSDWRQPRIKMIHALWARLADADEVKNNSAAACETWCVKHMKKDSLKWASSQDLNNCIEMLKQWALRTHVDIKA